MHIKIRTFAMLREIIGNKYHRIKISSPDVQTAIDELLEEFPELTDYVLKDGEFNPQYVLALNGDRVEREQFTDITLEEGDILAILPPAGGG